MTISSPAPGYRPYTTEFDREVEAGALHTVLGGLSAEQEAALDEAWTTLETGLLAWRTKLHLAAAEASSRVRARLDEEERASTVLSLLLDQSGSMRGQKMLYAAAAVDVAREFLVTLKVRCEVLGFTTSRWRGGRSRMKWKWRLRPKSPGRLNDLLHIIYTDADDLRASTGAHSFRSMLRPDMPKENIDGEAVVWASRRLKMRAERRKLLVVLSDGAPVDDSTLAANGPTLLLDHLRTVVETLQDEAVVELAALGIGFEAQDFYRERDFVEPPEELGFKLMELLERLLTGTAETNPPTPPPSP
ncbi:MAG TPA: hypothetical protein VGB54_06960 [Allosphingosinicella sp.]